MVIDTHALAWQPSAMAGVTQKALYQQAGFHDTMRLERWDPQTDPGPISYDRGAELFVLEGGFADEAGTYSAGCWMRLPVGSQHHPRSADGCTLYIKTAGLPYLRSAAT
ncbi:cupin domain-containing protein [bacterium]|nr:cupin domain-containing protein [bacterium]